LARLLVAESLEPHRVQEQLCGLESAPDTDDVACAAPSSLGAESCDDDTAEEDAVFAAVEVAPALVPELTPAIASKLLRPQRRGQSKVIPTPTQNHGSAE